MSGTENCYNGKQEFIRRGGRRGESGRMKLKRIQVSREVHGEGALQGRFLLGDALEKLDALAKEYAGQVKLIYLDPPFLTGELAVCVSDVAGRCFYYRIDGE